MKLTYRTKGFHEFMSRGSDRRCFIKKVNTWKTPVSESFINRATFCNFIKKETQTRTFSFEFCKTSQNTFFTEHFRVAASAYLYLDLPSVLIHLLFSTLSSRLFISKDSLIFLSCTLVISAIVFRHS